MEFGRGMPPEKEKLWRKMYQKEDQMKLQWFYKNQQRLVEIAEKERAKSLISPEVLEEVARMQRQRYENAKRYTKDKPGDAPIPEIDPNCILNVMKPKSKACSLLDRKQYLKSRCETLPEDRYYFAETTSFQYGWKVLEATREERQSYGRSQVIKSSFYRRNGALKVDPTHYATPQLSSPSACKDN